MKPGQPQIFKNRLFENLSTRVSKRKEIVDHQFRKQNLRKGGTDRQKDNIVSFIKDVIYK